ncbi:MAG: hypothetical protein LBM72_02380, partial [Mycoplasmataceae bacterium]|nr:hypothetical protein [Mycoplasmataceae bacterium]
MKINFITVNQILDTKEKAIVYEMLKAHGGIVLGNYFIINDKSFSNALKEIQSKLYNIGCESKKSASIMSIGKIKPTKPPITLEDIMAEIINIKITLAEHSRILDEHS